MTTMTPSDSFPMVYHGDRFLPGTEAAVSIFDRGLIYGDGLFETIRIQDGHPLHWDQHLDRLKLGAEFLRIGLPQSPEQLRSTAIQLARLNETSVALLRLTLTRGVAPRGYSTAQATHPTLFMTLHRAPPVDPQAARQWRLVTSRIRITPDDPLTRFKTCNRLPYVLARQDAETDQVDDALILNTRGEVAETSAANVFWFREGYLDTTPLRSGALPGITRDHVLRLAARLGFSVRESTITPAALVTADAVFLTVTSLGLIEVIELDHHPLARSPVVPSLHAEYCQSLDIRPPDTPA